MFRSITKKLKIIRMIVKRVSVNMMHHFFWFKISSNSLFHYKTVFINKFHFITKRMIWRKSTNISFYLNFTPFPIRTFFTSKSAIQRFTNFIFNFFGMRLSSIPRQYTSFNFGFTHFSFSFFRSWNAFIPRNTTFFGFTYIFSMLFREWRKFFSYTKFCITFHRTISSMCTYKTLKFFFANCTDFFNHNILHIKKGSTSNISITYFPIGVK